VTAVSFPEAGVRPVEIRLCGGSGCLALGALDVLETLRTEAAGAGLDVIVNARPGFVGCRGFCSEGPLLHLPGPDLLYCKVTPDDAAEILDRTVGRGEVVERLLHIDPVTGKRSRGLADNPFFVGQSRRVLARCGVVDPEDIEDAVALGAYDALTTAIERLDGIRIIDLVKRSGLQERGGTGFPVGLKWSVVAEATSSVKYVVGNGDGGDPGPCVDRTLLEGDPHGVIEGMAIAALAVGARVGQLFLRSDHALAIARAENAVAQAEHRGFLGRAILGSDFNFEIEICVNAGASMGGEETAMLNALEGGRAVARPRPPFPAVSGLWARPTLINSLETLANIPLIISEGVGDGAGSAEPTKVIGLSGRVARPGLAEVPLGTTVGRILDEVAGVREADEVRGVHLGGPGGVTLGPEQLDTPVDFSSLRSHGAHLGSAGMVVLGTDDCPVALARYLVATGVCESCGTCPPCRIGTTVMLNILDRIDSGSGEVSDLDRLERLGEHILRTSLCEVGRSAAVSTLASLRNFRPTYESHLRGGDCPVATRR
jgi:NADH:ubiquinone oxidoreductase subunit F (NADH-binding)/(2Fe-2S) ferredoxin